MPVTGACCWRSTLPISFVSHESARGIAVRSRAKKPCGPTGRGTISRMLSQDAAARTQDAAALYPGLFSCLPLREDMTEAPRVEAALLRLHQLLQFAAEGVVMGDRDRNAAKMHAERAGVEACVHEEAGHEMGGDGLAVDGGDEHALVTADRACAPARGRRENGQGRRRPASAPARRREERQADWDCCGAAMRRAGRCAG